MATNQKNLSDYDIKLISTAENIKFGIVVSDWHHEITDALYKGTYKTLIKYGVKEKNIIKKNVPGSFELSLAARFFAEYTDIDAIICLGCIIQGETRHFDFICQGVTHGITGLNMSYNIPFIFGVLTTNTLKQAWERTGGKHGNKGVEAAITAIKMVALQREMKKMEKK